MSKNSKKDKQPKVNILGLTESELSLAENAFNVTITAMTKQRKQAPKTVTIELEGVKVKITISDAAAAETVKGLLRAPGNNQILRGAVRRWTKLPEYSGIAIPTTQADKKEATRLLAQVANLGFTLREFLYPYEVNSADFIRYARLGDFGSWSGKHKVATFSGKTTPQGDLAQLHRLLVQSAWQRHEPIPEFVLNEYPDLKGSDFRYGYYRHGNFNVLPEGEYNQYVTHVINNQPPLELVEQADEFTWTDQAA